MNLGELIEIAAIGERCKSHKPMESSMGAWILKAERHAKMGRKQKQCPVCYRWFWKDEM